MNPSQTRGARVSRAPLPTSSKHLLPAAALSLLTILAFWNSFDSGFVLDNRGLLLNDPRLREATAANLRLIWQHTYWWPTGEGGVYRPFTTLTYLFNYAILGNRDHPGGYHAVNLLLHLANALMIYALAIRFIRRLWPAFFIAAIWAVHPVLTEAVTNIVGRADLLAATGLIGGFLAYLKTTEANGWRRGAWLGALAAFTLIGVFSKENAVVLPAVIVVYELTFGKRREWRRSPAGLAATLIPIGLMFYQRSIVLAASSPKEVPFTDNPILGASFWAGRLTAIDVLARYFWLMLWPSRLSSDYSWSEIPIAHGSIADWLALLAVLALIPALAILFRRNRGAFFLACIALAWMAPVSNVFFPIGTIMAERFLYVPLLGFVTCVVLGICSAAKRLRMPAYTPGLFCLLLIAALVTRTWVRNYDWKDDLSIATASVKSSPNSFKTHDLLANVLYAADNTYANIDQVIKESEKSLAILNLLPDNRSLPDPYQLAGTCYLYRGDYGKAITALLRFLAIEKAVFAEFRTKLSQSGASSKSAERITAARQGDAYTLLSMAYLRAGDANAASDAAARARTLHPLSPQLYRQLAEIALKKGRLDEAAATYVEGAFVLSDGSLRHDLVALYQKQLPPGNCALKPGPRGLALNTACPMVRANLCAAEAGTIKTLVDTDQNELAQARQKMFVEEFGCKVGQAVPPAL
jgi:tetratricopeptide (TPR) repeat protein